MSRAWRGVAWATILVVLVVILFLQTWRASIIPLVAVPVSVIGTFAVLHLLGFSIITLSLFGLVLATGIVVDDWSDTPRGVTMTSARHTAAVSGAAHANHRSQP